MQSSCQLKLLMPPLLLLLLLLLLVPKCSSEITLNISASSNSAGIILTTEKTDSVNLTVAGNAANGTLLLQMESERIASIESESQLQWSAGDANQTFEILLRGRTLGWTHIGAQFNSSSGERVTLMPARIRMTVLREQTVLQLVYRYLLIVMVILVVFGMGTTIDVKIVMQHVRRPVALIIGWSLQFVLMPHLALGIGQLLCSLLPDLENVETFAFGLLAVGCSPGGGGSNAWTLLYGGDLDLSMTMTFFSQICALFMMPLWLFLYSGLYLKGDDVSIPYLSITINLLQLAVPVIVGILVKVKFPKFAEKIRKVLKIFALVFVLVVIGFGLFVNSYLFELIARSPIVIPFAALVPWFGFVLGFIIARLCSLQRSQAVAVALECGIQNIGIPILILQFSMPKPDGDLATIIPLIVALVTPLPLYFGLAIMKILARIRGKSEDYEADKQQGDGEEMEGEEKKKEKAKGNSIQSHHNSGFDSVEQNLNF